MQVTAASGSVGAYVDGIELARLSDEDRRAVVAAWHEFGVLFFRGQHLSPDDQVEAARIFGEPEFFEMAPAVDAGTPLVHEIRYDGPRRHGGASSWHSDATWKEMPPRGSLLQAIELPAVGGDTLFAGAHAAWASLSAGMQQFVGDLTATHEGGAALGRASAKVRRDVPEPVHHPVVRRHDETGQPCLYVNRSFTSRIDGVPRNESDALLPMLCDTFGQPEVQCRFRWEVGDVAVWDNRAVQHYATPDYAGARLMHRVVLAGDAVVPVSPATRSAT